jgi:hypothetical protein
MKFENSVYTLTPEEAYDRWGMPRRMTTWRNPLPTAQRVTIDLDHKIARTIPRGVNALGVFDGERVVEHPVQVVYEVLAHGTIEIPSTWDSAMHRIVNGAVIGGLAPQLVRDGQTETVDPALLPSSAQTTPRYSTTNRLIED